MNKLMKILLVLCVMVSQFTFVEKIQAKEETSIQSIEMFEEVFEKRSESSKTFQTGINSYQTFQFASRVHYIDSNGDYQNIDNTLQAYTDRTSDDVNGFENKANDLKIKFAKKAHATNMVSLKKDNYKIMFGSANANKNHKVIVESKQEDHNEIRNALSKINQKITYQDVYEHIDIEYITSADGIKENIIIKEKQSLNEFVFNFKVYGLNLILKEDGSIHAVNEANEVVYVMPAPYMEDALGNKSYDVAYKLDGSNKKYTISIIAEETWLNDEDRVYPIIIDPYIVTEIDRSQRKYIDTTYVTTDNPNKNYNGEADLCVGYDPDDEDTDGLEHCRTYLRFKKLPTLSTSDMVIDAKVCFNVDDISMYSIKDQINVYDVSSDWNVSSITWNNQPSHTDSDYALDYEIITEEEHVLVHYQNYEELFKTFDVTEAAKKWYETGNNYGLMFKSSKENTVTWDIATKTQFYSSKEGNAIGCIPFLVISYISNKGLEDYFSYTSGSSGSAGSFYVDNYTGNLVIEHIDGSTVGNRMPALLAHYYNASSYDKHMDSNMIVGKGWKLNIYQTIKETSDSLKEDFPYVYTDGDATEIYFRKIVEDNTTKYIDDTGRGLSLEKSDGIYTITDKSNQKMIFNNGKLFKIIDANNNYIEYQYENNRITAIWDSASHYLKLNYSGNNLMSVEDMAGRKTIYSYDENNCLTKITYPDGTYSTYTYDGLLTSMWNSDSTRIQFRYTSSGIKRISQVYEESSSGEKGQIYHFDRSLYNTCKIRNVGRDGIENNAMILFQYYNLMIVED